MTSTIEKIPAFGIVTVVAPWIRADLDPMRASIVSHAFEDLGILEDPIGSNRGPEIDEMNRAGGSPLASYWCANALGKWWRAGGAITPRPGLCGSCDEWVRLAKKLETWREKGSGYGPEPGDAVVYGKPTDANHIGLVVRRTPLLLSIEGNTSFGGHTRNGVAVDLKEAALDRIIGYIRPKGITI